jgi:site-specific DNA-methyltransferase (cytosine-N4-specific)
MSGSGTTLVEAVLAGFRGWGIDMNPLSVFLGQVKCKLLSADASMLLASYEQLREELLSSKKKRANQLQYLESLPAADQDYLTAWFSKTALKDLDEVMQAISRCPSQDARDLMRVSVSNILRRVSWQKEDDLRIRKEIRPDAEIDVKKEFLEELDRSVRAVLAFLYQNGATRKAFKAIRGDARNCVDVWNRDSIDLVVTSPPYATALPYLDTDRLSLCYLGLLPRPEHRSRDQMMIGNREVTEKLRRIYWSQFEVERASLPENVSALIDRINNLNKSTDAGFRRRNLPALLSKYFFDMKKVMSSIHKVLKPRSLAFVVVGNNHTIAGGKRVDIWTASLLQEIAKQAGFRVAESLPMEMLVSRDIFRKNTTASEEILTLYKPG